jgi:hypothetical protein
LDLHEHGISAYPEYVIHSVAKPGGMIAQEKASLATESAQPRGILRESTQL